MFRKKISVTENRHVIYIFFTLLNALITFSDKIFIANVEIKNNTRSLYEIKKLFGRNIVRFFFIIFFIG